MEPTGIEPVTSCLQNDRAVPLYGPISRRLRRIATRAERGGYGGTRHDWAGFGQRTGAAAQLIPHPSWGTSPRSVWGTVWEATEPQAR
jgi:hypothetical protein